MKTQARHYDRTLLIELEDLVSEPDLVQLSGWINTLASKLGAVVLDLHKAQLEPSVASTVMRLKKQYEKNKLKFLVVSPELIGADAGNVAAAVASLKSTESARIAEIFAHEKEIFRLQKEAAKVRDLFVAAMGLKEGPEPLPKDELSRALHALEDKNKQLMRLFKTLSSEIIHLSGKHDQITMPGADNPTAVRIAESKRKALDIVKSTKVLD